MASFQHSDQKYRLWKVALERKIYFLRGEITEKNALIRSLVTPYTPHAELKTTN